MRPGPSNAEGSMILAMLNRLFVYDAWGNRAALDSLRNTPAAPPRAVALLAHLAGSGRLWLERLHGRPQSLPVWPALGLDECARAFEENREAWAAYLSNLEEDDLRRTVTYVNTKGERFESSIADILLHVTHHGAYHRGQIALLVRHVGAEPAYTDYVHAARTGRLEG